MNPTDEAPEEVLPTWDLPLPTDPPAAIPLTEPILTEEAPMALPMAEAVEEAPPEPRTAEPAPATIPCPVCQSPHVGKNPYCLDCGYYFSPAELSVAAVPAAPAVRLQDRFEIGAKVGERRGVERFHGIDCAAEPPVLVWIIRQSLTPVATAEPGLDSPSANADSGLADDEILPGFDDFPTTESMATAILPARPGWPSLAWEEGLLHAMDHPALPAVVASFTEGDFEYLIEEKPAGRVLWDAWDDPASRSEERFGWLAGRGNAAHAPFVQRRPRRHSAGHYCRGAGRPGRLTDLADLLPIPLPGDAAVRGTFYTAPELTTGNGQTNARADLYSFGAMMYALHVGRELTDTDFEKPGEPKPFIPLFPDVHPALGRLISKTFRKEVNALSQRRGRQGRRHRLH